MISYKSKYFQTTMLSFKQIWIGFRINRSKCNIKPKLTSTTAVLFSPGILIVSFSTTFTLFSDIKPLSFIRTSMLFSSPVADGKTLQTPAINQHNIGICLFLYVSGGLRGNQAFTHTDDWIQGECRISVIQLHVQRLARQG